MLVRRLDRVGRKLFMHRVPERLRTAPVALIERWRRLLAIARLAEDIDAERDTLLPLLDT
jgi:hypothetical protein